LDVVSTAVRFIIVMFVFIAGAITLAGPQLGIDKNISTAKKVMPVETNDKNLKTSAHKPANKEPDTTS
jgi:hypothetical protein